MEDVVISKLNSDNSYIPKFKKKESFKNAKH